MAFEQSEIYKAITARKANGPSKVQSVLETDTNAVQLVGRRNETFLHVIAESYQSEEDDPPKLIPIIYQLSNAGIEANVQDNEGNTALHSSAKKGNKRHLVRALLTVGVDPSLPNKAGKTAEQVCQNVTVVAIIRHFSPGLWQAVTNTSTRDVDRLLSSWCKVDQRKGGHTLIEYAQSTGNSDMVKRLNKAENTNKLVHSILSKNKSDARRLLKKGFADANTATSCGFDKDSGALIAVPLVAEAAILNLRFQVKKLLRKKANADIILDDNTPLILYILRHLGKTDKPYDALELVIDATDFQRFRKYTTDILDRLYQLDFPLVLMRKMAINGLDLFRPNEKGHFMRDQIYLDNWMKKESDIKQQLTFVDQIIVDLAASGKLDMLKSLLLRGYEHFDVTDKEGKAARMELARSKGPDVSEKFFDSVIPLSKQIRLAHKRTAGGILMELKSLLTESLMNGTDRIGRTVFHVAVMFEHRFIINHIIKLFPKVAFQKDMYDRSPLHLACLLNDGQDIQAALEALGLSMAEKDMFGRTPKALLNLPPEDKATLPLEEKKSDPGIDVYLFQRYQTLKEAIRQGSVVVVEEVRFTIYKDISLDSMTSLMYHPDTRQKSLLLFAMDARRDAISKYFLTQGMSWKVKYKDGDEDISLLEAAKRKEMKGVIEYIQFQKAKKEEEQQTLKNLRKAGVGKLQDSKTCVLI